MKIPKKIKIKVKARPEKLRRIWKVKPMVRVKPSDRKVRLGRIREREARDDR
ncbi:MAG: hypothetical protein ACREL1_09005 [bacterium]